MVKCAYEYIIKISINKKKKVIIADIEKYKKKISKSQGWSSGALEP